MVGNIEDAALALTRPRPYFFDEGSERACYLINGVIYKVNRHGGYGNTEELDSYDYLIRQVFPLNITIAQLTPYYIGSDTVVAAEYVQGQNVGECYDVMLGLPCADPSTCLDDWTASAIRSLGINDLCYGNVIRRGEQYVIVDMEG